MGSLKALPSLMSSPPPAIGEATRQDAQRALDQFRRARNLRNLYITAAWRGENGLRLEVLERDGWLCQGCTVPHLLKGAAPAPNSPVVEHIA